MLGRGLVPVTVRTPGKRRESVGALPAASARRAAGRAAGDEGLLPPSDITTAVGRGAYRSVVVFHSCRLRMLSGKATMLR